MRREYTVEHYMGLLEKLRAAQPEIVLSTDIIVGFPNETVEEYQKTLDMLEAAQYDFIYSYVFSSRKGTKAARMEDFLTNDEKGERLRHLQKFQLEIQAKIRKKLEGEEFSLLVEGESSMKGIRKWKGRTNCNRIVHFLPKDDQDLKWNWVDVKIKEATALSCQGELLHVHGKSLSS